MYTRKTLFFMVFLKFCYTNEDVTAQGVKQGSQMAKWTPQIIQRSFPRMGWSSMNFDSSIPDAYASPKLSCHGEGFYSHPSECSKFYRCINDFGNNDYSALTFTCATGTIFSQELGSCVSGSCSPDGVSGSGVPTVGVSASGLLLHHCVSEGRFADPVDCGQYYDCVRGINGDFIATRQTCFGHAFDATHKECVPLQKANECIPKPINGLRSTNANNPELQNLCKDHENKFFCMDCKTLVMCIGGTPQIIPCKYGDVCYKDETIFSGGVCYPDAPVNCTCKNENIFQPDIYDNSKFLSCGTQGAEPVIQSCPDGLEFNEQFSSCGAPINTTCSESGTFAVQSDCTNYHTCTYTTTGLFFQSVFTCDNNTMYNDETGKCEQPCDWYTGNFTCEQEGRFSNRGDCTKFFECLNDPLNIGEFIRVEHECLEGYEWLPLVNRRHCVAKGTTEEICIPEKLNTCEVPREWCISTTDISSQAIPIVRDLCPDGHFQVGTQCFSIPTEGFKSWFDAQAFCMEQGGFLAEPESIPAFQEALENETSDYGFWLGGSNKKQDRSWRWSSRGAMVGNSNSWNADEPDSLDTSEKCLLLMRGMEKPLAARSCDAEYHYFICEKH